MTKQLLCGSAKSKITPSENLLPNLRGLRDSRFGGILDDLFLRVVFIDNNVHQALIISFDLDKALYPKEYLKIISEKTNIPEEFIFYFSIHTHTAPITGFRPEEGPNDLRKKEKIVQDTTKEYEQFLLEKLLETIDLAMQSKVPVRMGYSYGKSYINQNRNQDFEFVDEFGELKRQCSIGSNSGAEVDRTVFLLKFEDFEGNPVAYFINYPVHNTVMLGNQCFDGIAGISGDIGGNVSRFMEDRFDGCVAVWSSGAAGDINPLMSNEFYYPDPKTGKPVVEQIPGGNTSILKMMSAMHFDDIVRMNRNIVCSKEYIGIDAVIEWSFTPGQNVIRQDDGSFNVEIGENVDPYEIRLHMLRLGDVFLYGFSGELFSSLGKKIKEISPAKNTILINHEATFMARSNYIFDDETLCRDNENLLPGHGNTHLLPGYVSASLIEHTLSIFNKLFN